MQNEKPPVAAQGAASNGQAEIPPTSAKAVDRLGRGLLVLFVVAAILLFYVAQPQAETALATGRDALARSWLWEHAGTLLAYALFVALALAVAFRSWLRVERLGLFAFFVLAGLSIVAAITFVYFTVRSASEQTRQIRHEIRAASGESKLYAQYPAKILADGKPITVTLTLAHPAGLVSELTATLSIPAGARVVSPPMYADLRAPAITFPPTSRPGQSVALNLVNTAQDTCLVCPDAALGLWVGGRGWDPPQGAEYELPPIQVEGTDQKAWRTFIATELGEKTPIFLGITGLLTLAGLVFREYRQSIKREAEKREKDEKEEAERQEKAEQAEREAQAERERVEREKNAAEKRDREQQEEADAELDAVRECLRRRRVDEARAHRRNLRDRGWQRRVDAQHLRWSDELLLLFDGEVPTIDFANMDDGWREAAAGALLVRRSMAVQAGQPIPDGLRRELENLARFLPEGDLQNAVRSAATNRPKVPPDWPVLSPTVLDTQLVTYTDSRGQQYPDPFPAVPFSRECDLLYSSNVGLYYTGHPLYDRLDRTDDPLLVLGDSGAGRSTLALSLGRYHIRREGVLGCYIPWGPTGDAIRHALAHQLLNYVRDQPLQLTPLDASQRRILADLLVAGLGQNAVIARLSKRDRPQDNQTLSEAEENILFFREAVEAARPRDLASSGTWDTTLAALADNLEFKKIRIVVDVQPDGGDWLEREMLPLARHWAMHDAVLIVLAPSSLLDASGARGGANIAASIGVEQLSWQADAGDALAGMFERRYEILAASLQNEARLELPYGPLWPLRSVLVKSSRANPRCLARLHQALVRKLQAGEDVTAERVSATAAGIECP